MKILPIPEAHDWRRCRPTVVMPLTDADPLDHGLPDNAFLAAWWDALSDHDREGWHRAHCLGSRAPDDLISANKIAMRIWRVLHEGKEP